jgi:hypothetical protein
MDLGFPKPDIRGELQFGNNMLYTEPCKMLYISTETYLELDAENHRVGNSVITPVSMTKSFRADRSYLWPTFFAYVF